MRLDKLALLMLLASLALASPISGQDGSFELTIMHSNDVNAVHEPDDNGDGGAARQATVVRRIRAEVANSLLLDAGNRFTGTLFHIAWQGQDNARIMNLLDYDAMAPGGHEFDDGDEVLANFIEALEFPLVAANIDFDYSAALVGKVAPWVILDVGGERIGVSGLVTAVRAMLSAPGPSAVVDRDLLSATQGVVEELQAEGVNKIILLSSSGMADALELAPQLSGVDVIIVSQGNELFSNTYANAANSYPAVRESATGDPVLIVMAGQHSQYLGRLDVEFDAGGTLTDWEGDVIHLSRYIAPAADVVELVADLAGPIQQIGEMVVGETTVPLEGGWRACGVSECPLGNLLTDALRERSGAQIAYINGNGFYGNIAAGEITLNDLLEVHPYNDIIETFNLTGTDLVAVLEQAVMNITLNEAGQVRRDDASGNFLQLSGVRFSADPGREPGERIVSVEVRNAAGEYEALDPDAVYQVIGNDYIRKGGEGHSVLAEKAFDLQADDYVDYLLTMDYIAAFSPVSPVLEGRINWVNAEVEPYDGNQGGR
ncbi:MAG: 5'-nucleotidase C-terminal domain-containing protein [Anaerolineaceae bacterium]|nr:5'-nucleotidase C-terminal domain-containing protein [Anaerolineaceae bacterium]